MDPRDEAIAPNEDRPDEDRRHDRGREVPDDDAPAAGVLDPELEEAPEPNEPG